MKNKYYITTTLPYVNSSPHIGFAAEVIRADVLARYNRQLGNDVFFNTGTDEHGLKIFRNAEEQGVTAQEYCDGFAAEFTKLKETLNLSFDNFIRTTDEYHIKAAQEFWKRCEANGDIYKKNYKVKYCVGCELEKTESELVDGKCPVHPNQEIEEIEEENYFFRWSNYQEKLLKLYKDNPDFVIPKHRLTEIKNFVESGLNDFSISRLKEKMPWGISVPGDEDHVMYVWFDALTNYVNTLGWPEGENFKNFWPGMQVAGKDNLRQQSAMWQAMLMSAGLAPSEQVLIFGFITSGGQKMSKSLGNVINPIELVEKYGIAAVRYFLLSELVPFEDGDFTIEKFEEAYNVNLANGLGNLVSRTANLIGKNEIEIDIKENSDKDFEGNVKKKMDIYRFDEAMRVIWGKIKESDEFLSNKAPWKMEDKQEIKEVLEIVAQNVLNIAYHLKPFLPGIAEKITEQYTQKQITKGDPMFPRV
ncbi:methionine--tRNA ligase [Candidatus Parcubacteria bacterium]|nr:MAG: methionine--tRNA ligase [Candidatus Parcubacteria bacterium]